jgi:hypothetical protein
MKTLLFVTTFVLAASLAQAKELTCSSHKPDGLVVIVNIDKTAASISLKSANGLELLQDLQCRPVQNPKSPFADQMVSLAICKEDGLFDAGYTVRISTGGFAGLTMAHVSETTIVGFKKVDTLICRRA